MRIYLPDKNTPHQNPIAKRFLLSGLDETSVLAKERRSSQGRTQCSCLMLLPPCLRSLQPHPVPYPSLSPHLTCAHILRKHQPLLWNLKPIQRTFLVYAARNTCSLNTGLCHLLDRRFLCNLQLSITPSFNWLHIPLS